MHACGCVVLKTGEAQNAKLARNCCVAALPLRLAVHHGVGSSESAICAPKTCSACPRRLRSCTMFVFACVSMSCSSLLLLRCRRKSACTSVMRSCALCVLFSSSSMSRALRWSRLLTCLSSSARLCTNVCMRRSMFRWLFWMMCIEPCKLLMAAKRSAMLGGVALNTGLGGGVRAE